MRKITILAFLFLLLGIKCSLAQYPIPSYNVQVTGRAVFLEENPLRGKRTITVLITHTKISEISLQGDDSPPLIWIFSQDGSTIYGPYEAPYNKEMTFTPDERQWGVLVESTTEVLVDIWYPK